MPNSAVEGPANVDDANAPDAVIGVGPFLVADLSRRDVVSRIVSWPLSDGPAIMFHLHVGALNLRRETDFVSVMNSSAMTYADGMATVLVGKAAGAKNLERAGLTDIGHDVIREFAHLHGRPARIACLGGPASLARRAGEVLAETHDCVLVYSSDGFHDDAGWSEVLSETTLLRPDIVFVGLGMPLEAFWVRQFALDLPPALILAAGGFFGHVVGDEKRAPKWAQKVGLEWLWRVRQAPGRLALRYAKGLLSTALLSIDALRKRR